MRLIDGVNVSIKPIIHGLTAGAHQRPSESDADDDQQPTAFGTYARGNSTASECPHRREPRHRFQQLKHRRKLRRCSS